MTGNLVHFTSGSKLCEWVKSNPALSKEAFFLIDYELMGEQENGLDHIVALNLNHRAILVTSRYDEPEIRNRILLEKIKLLPKGLASLLPIKTHEGPIFSVLIDDQSYNHGTWEFYAKKRGKKVITVFDENEFFNHIVPSSTAIFVDRQLKDKVLGENVIRNLHAAGYANLSLYTSDDELTKASFPNHPYIRHVFLKEDIDVIFGQKTKEEDLRST